jgi:tRNA A37 threonylcarbamoyladenosine dehydratase
MEYLGIHLLFVTADYMVDACDTVDSRTAIMQTRNVSHT